MKVVLDSNVLLSALISPYASPHQIFVAWQKHRFELITCPQQIDEIQRASRYPKLQHILQPHRVGTLINNLHGATVIELETPTQSIARDPHDAFLLTLAEVGQADALVTGDHRAGLLELGSYARARIVTPARFCSEMLHIGDSALR